LKIFKEAFLIVLNQPSLEFYFQRNNTLDCTSVTISAAFAIEIKSTEFKWTHSDPFL
jgi:hypothetical protein